MIIMTHGRRSRCEAASEKTRLHARYETANALWPIDLALGETNRIVFHAIAARERD